MLSSIPLWPWWCCLWRCPLLAVPLCRCGAELRSAAARVAVRCGGEPGTVPARRDIGPTATALALPGLRPRGQGRERPPVAAMRHFEAMPDEGTVAFGKSGRGGHALQRNIFAESGECRTAAEVITPFGPRF